MKNIKQGFYEKAYPKNLRLSSPHYSFVYSLLKKYERYREDVTYELLPVGSKFLDIGCGEGDLVFRALDKFKQVYGSDIAKTRLNNAIEKLNKIYSKNSKRVKFIINDADTKMPFRNNFFDSITMIATLEHFFDPYQVLIEITRILKKGGILIIQVPNLTFLPRRLDALLGKLPVTSDHENGWDGGHLHYFTVNSLKNFLIKYGFKIDQVTCSGIFANFRMWWVSLLGADIIIKAIKE